MEPFKEPRKYEIAHCSWLYHTQKAKESNCKIFALFHQARARELYNEMAEMAELIPIEKLLNDLATK